MVKISLEASLISAKFARRDSSLDERICFFSLKIEANMNSYILSLGSIFKKLIISSSSFDINSGVKKAVLEDIIDAESIAFPIIFIYLGLALSSSLLCLA